MKRFLLICFWICLSKGLTAQNNSKRTDYAAYLFVYFTGNDKSEEQIRFALSNDGYHFRALNNDKPVILSEKISSTGGVRDPHILRSADGKTFYMVATDMVSAKGWNSNRAMVLLKSNDLIHWTSSVINIQNKYPHQEDLERVWAPQTIYDPVAKKYVIYFSMKHGNDPDKIYYAYVNNDFTDLEGEPKQLFFSPSNGACIDGDIVSREGKYYLFFKTEGRGDGIKIAVSDKLTEGYVLRDKYVQQTQDPVEGAGTFKLNDGSGYILMYDVYTKGKYQFTHTKDLEHFAVVDQDVSMDFHPRHGTVMPITMAEAARLEMQWGGTTSIMGSSISKQVHLQNMVVDTVNRKVFLSVKPGTNLHAFNPDFILFPGTRLMPATNQDFTNGAVKYTVSIEGKKPEIWMVEARETHNPVLDGYYADPDILYAQKTNRFYIYPTSDGFNGWSGTYFKTFSSSDLVHWKDDGVILNLNKDVSWGKKNAWAPTISEKKINGQYKYFYYFCAAQKIGVAVSDNPTGPFIDSGKPLVDRKPDAITGGQEIDPAVFTDPQTGKSYLYWGNGYMAGAELNEDMVSLKPGTTIVLTPDKTFREGTYVFYRKEVYYFMWSEDDTRSPNYRVRYGTSLSPLGKISLPVDNIVIEKDTTSGIYGTGHNAVIQIPGKDEWYIAYHRFTYPKGITMGDAAGYNRETCIDKMVFNADGTIKKVVPTHVGISPLKMK